MGKDQKLNQTLLQENSGKQLTPVLRMLKMKRGALFQDYIVCQIERILIKTLKSDNFINL